MALNLATLPNDLLLCILDHLPFHPLRTLSLVTWHLRLLIAPRIFRTYTYHLCARPNSVLTHSGRVKAPHPVSYISNFIQTLYIYIRASRQESAVQVLCSETSEFTAKRMPRLKVLKLWCYGDKVPWALEGLFNGLSSIMLDNVESLRVPCSATALMAACHKVTELELSCECHSEPHTFSPSENVTSLTYSGSYHLAIPGLGRTYPNVTELVLQHNIRLYSPSRHVTIQKLGVPRMIVESFCSLKDVQFRGLGEASIGADGARVEENGQGEKVLKWEKRVGRT